MKKRLLILVFMLVLALLLVGCSDSNDGNTGSDEGNNEASNIDANEEDNETVADPEEVTVSLMIHWGEDAFESYFNQFVKEALPHINLTYIQARNQNDIEENFTKGLVPDLVMGSNFEMYRELDLARDQTPLIELHGLDLDRLDPYIVESLRNASPDGELLALPLFRPDGMMAYNKDIFDAFGVPYPTDNMTWDEIIELGRQLIGERDGNIYHGVFPDKDQLSQVSATLIDGETDEPNILENNELRIFLERQQTIFNLPGNLPEMDSVEELAEFIYSKSGSTDLVLDYALVPGVGFHGLVTREVESGLNFDWITYPTWGGEYPDFIPNSLYHNIFVTSQSENPDAAFEVLQYLLSDEYQKESIAQGRLTPLVNSEVQSEIGKAMDHYEILKEKNWEAQFLIPGAPIPKQSAYEQAVREELIINAYRRLLEGDDINTVIRVMDEEARGMIADLKSRQ